MESTAVNDGGSLVVVVINTSSHTIYRWGLPHLHILPAAVSPIENNGRPFGWSSFSPHGLTTA